MNKNTSGTVLVRLYVKHEVIPSSEYCKAQFEQYSYIYYRIMETEYREKKSKLKN